jgi:hypothetical protein
MSTELRIDALLPAEMARRAEYLGVRKAEAGVLQMFALAVLAGGFIAMGAVFATTAAAGASGVLPYGVTRLMVGLVFCLGLILVIVGGAELFTGNNLIVMAWASGKVSTRNLLRNWIIVYIGNFVGSLGTALLVFLSKQHTFGGGAIGLAALPLVLFLLYGLVWTQRMAGQFSLRFFPSLWGRPSFYWLWLQKMDQTAGLAWVALAVCGVALIGDSRLRSVLLGAWAGYFVYGWVFAYHVTTHDYYHLPLLGLTAISLAAVVQRLFAALAAVPELGRVKAAGLVLLVGVVLCLFGSANTLYTLRKTDYRPQAVFWAQVGQQIGPNERVLALTQDYGYPLVYWGWRNCEIWLSAGDFEYRALAGNSIDVAELFAESVKQADVFLVTDFEEWQRQPELQQLLGAHRARVQSDAVYIFDLKEKQP